MKSQSIRFLLVAGVLCQALLLGPAFGALVDLVPVEAQFVMQINMAKVANLDLTQKVFDQFGATSADAEKAMKEFIEKTGIDPKKNLKSIVLFLTALTDSKTGRPVPGILFEGDYDTAHILELLKADKELASQLVMEKVEGFDAVKSKKAETGTSVFLDKNTILIANADIIKSVIEVKGGKAKGLMANPTFAKVVKQANPEVGLWGGVVVSPQWVKEAADNPVSANFAAVKAVLFTLSYDKNFAFELAGEVEKKEETAKVKEALKNTIDAMAAWANDVPDVAKALKGAVIDGAETTAKLTLAMEKPALDELIKKVQAQLNQPAKEPAPAKGK